MFLISGIFGKKRKMNTSEDFFLTIPNEVIQYILSFLDIKSAIRCHSVSKTWNNLLSQGSSKYIWKQLMSKKAVTHELGGNKLRNFDHNDWKKLCVFTEKNSNLGMFSILRKESHLIGLPIEASSVDDEDQEISNTLIEVSSSEFWSSVGTDESDTDDHLIYQLKTPFYGISDSIDISNQQREHERTGLLYLDSFFIEFFKAGWQNDNIYSSRKISIEIGTSKTEFIWKSEMMDICIEDEQNYNGQKIILSRPILLIESEDDNNNPKVIDEDELGQQQQKEKDEDDECLDPTNTQKMERIRHEIRMIRTLLHNNFQNEEERETTEEMVDQQEEEEEEEDGLLNFGFLQRIVMKRVKQKRRIKRRQNNVGKWFVKVNFHGKVKQQPEDDLFFVCVNRFECFGVSSIM